MDISCEGARSWKFAPWIPYIIAESIGYISWIKPFSAVLIGLRCVMAYPCFIFLLDQYQIVTYYQILTFKLVWPLNMTGNICSNSNQFTALHYRSFLSLESTVLNISRNDRYMRGNYRNIMLSMILSPDFIGILGTITNMYSMKSAGR